MTDEILSVFFKKFEDTFFQNNFGKLLLQGYQLFSKVSKKNSLLNNQNILKNGGQKWLLFGKLNIILKNVQRFPNFAGEWYN